MLTTAFYHMKRYNSIGGIGGGDPARELGPLREIAHRLEKNSLGLISSQGDVAQENI